MSVNVFKTLSLSDWHPAIQRARAQRNDVADRIRARCNDELLSRVLDVAEFYRWRDNCDGSRTPFFILVKPIPGHAAGNVLALSELHAALRATHG